MTPCETCGHAEDDHALPFPELILAGAEELADTFCTVCPCPSFLPINDEPGDPR